MGRSVRNMKKNAYLSATNKYRSYYPMMKNKTILSLAAALCVAATATAQTVTVSPQPQRIIWGEKAFDRPQSIQIKGAEEADTDAVALLNSHFTASNKGVKVVIGERGDKAVKKFVNQIPDKVEGYYIRVAEDQVVVAGNDEAGTYYGVQTLMQLLSQPEVMKAEIKDWPDVLERGVVEGFYGNPWSHKDRLRQFEFYGKNKLNVYIYGPKDDPYHRNQWRDPYPADEALRISELAKAAAQNKVDFVWAMHPGGDIQWTEEDLKSSVQKLEWMYGLGVRAFAIFFDDIFGAEQSKGAKQAEYMNALNREFVQKHDDVAPLILCPTQYNKSWSGGSYLNDLGSTMDKDIRIMWTGATVVDMINKTDMDWINNQIHRNAYIWLNYPVNDFCIDHMLMGPTYGNDLDIAHQLSGFVSNPMEYAEASKVSLYSIADYTWNMDAYESQTSWERALRVLMPEHVDAFRVFCQHNVDLGPTGHGLRRKGESAAFKQSAEKFSAAIAQGYNADAVEEMTKEFTGMVAAADELLNSSEEPEMIAEIAPWLEVMKIIGQRGEHVMNLYTLLEKGDEKGFVATYEQLAKLEQAQKAIISRGFEGSIKKPNPTVANEEVVPFIKTCTKGLIRSYKSKFSYRTDIFPAELLEEGRYYIKVNGVELTDQITVNEPLWYLLANDECQDYSDKITYDLVAALSASTALKKTQTLEHTSYTKMSYFVEGIISNMRNTPEEIANYKAARFDISDDGSTNNQYYCYGIKWLDNSHFTTGEEIAVGDKVVIYGQMKNTNDNQSQIKGYVYQYGKLASLDNIVENQVSDLYDIMGRKVEVSAHMPSGVYLLRSGDKITKIYINK